MNYAKSETLSTKSIGFQHRDWLAFNRNLASKIEVIHTFRGK